MLRSTTLPSCDNVEQLSILIEFVEHVTQHNWAKHKPLNHKWSEEFLNVSSSLPVERRLNDSMPYTVFVVKATPTSDGTPATHLKR